jgi:hypothetical protein
VTHEVATREAWLAARIELTAAGPGSGRRGKKFEGWPRRHNEYPRD